MGAAIEPLNTIQLINTSQSLSANEIFTSDFVFAAPYSRIIGFIQAEAGSLSDGVAVEFSNNKTDVFRTYVATMDGTRNPLSILTYIALTDTYYDNTLMEASFAVAPVTNNTNDFTYIGYGSKFKGFTITVDSSGVYDVTLGFQYWNGSAWTTLNVVDDTIKLTTSGDITFSIPSDWQRTAVDGTLGYFIRYRATVISSLSNGSTLSNINIHADEFDVIEIDNLAYWVRFIFENGSVAQDIKIMVNGRRK
ncbi:hypothetical protein [Bacteroides sp.]|uniref:hypothetical protein n=1 Tax=Bacteroides sp. TaxID=29523 RepID=UPI00262A11FC|nr:hypothetical protein [Bacteroides sp.]MDD3039601.1 hypothetical protein [Bacteroides sp.]